MDTNLYSIYDDTAAISFINFSFYPGENMFSSDAQSSFFHLNRSYRPVAIPTDDVIPVSRTALLQALHNLQSEQQRLPQSDLRPAIQMLQRFLSTKSVSAA